MEKGNPSPTVSWGQRKSELFLKVHLKDIKVCFSADFNIILISIFLEQRMCIIGKQ